MNIRTSDGIFLTLEEGCYVAGHHGQYAVDEVCQIVDTLLGGEWSRMISEAREMDDFDAVVEISDEALEALNEATTGGRWYWDEGEVFLTPIVY